MIQRILIVTISLLIGWQAQAQDIHLSQYPYSPLNLNPAETGLYDEHYRFALNYRNQWRNNLVPFNTVSFSFEMPVYDFKNYDRIATGLLFFYDQAGDLNFQTFQLEIPINYIKVLDEDRVHTMSIGIQPGILHRGIDYTNIRLDENYNPNDIGQYDPNGFPVTETFANNGFTDFDLGLGWSYRIRPKKKDRWEFQFGLAVRHLLQPAQSFFNEDIPLNIKYTAYTLNNIRLGEDWDFIPQFMYQRQDTKQEFVLGTTFRVHLSNNEHRTFNFLFGHFWRNRDASIAFLGTEYNNWHVGISYDFNVLSDLKSASNRRGGIEASLIYKISKVDTRGFEDAICPLF